ncbi:uncharacterized protein LOC129595554 [Paramacrobiotus metropolitanus]|uniref:uncharacterized protein LOC129595554 n=1 Tax=Paramacrobiotus metropolitanus TaxID=2943436 RepID=UPI002445E469|nr:uncharacterized protein LOC129595554 [Paramacrobiotus metropolitanus]
MAFRALIIPLALLVYFVLLSKYAAAQSYSNINGGNSTKCRCLPGDSCWPSDADWNALNTSLAGRLVIPHPTAYPCYAGAGFNSRDCQQIQKYYNRPGFLITKPGSMQNFNWEDLGAQRCTLESGNEWGVVCQSGRTPAYAVDAHSPEDIQRAMSFASKHNLRVVVKTTGHDYLGRSTAPGALLIWLHNFEGQLETKTSFTLSGCDASSQSVGPVITVAGGKTWDDVYPKVEQDFNGKYAIVAGNCFDIGAAGGYILGGGHSIISPSFGLAVDSVLEMKIVTVDGQLLTANACQNTDLFWALRGGGGGTYGVLTSVTYQLHSVPNGFTSYSIQILAANKTGDLNPKQLEDVLEVLSRRTADLDAVGWGGYYYFNAAFGFSLMWIVPADWPNALVPVEAIKDELVAMQASSGFLVGPFANVGGFVQHFNGVSDWRSWANTVGVYDESLSPGIRTTLGTRLIPAAALNQSRSVAQNIIAAAAKTNFLFGFGILHVSGNGVRSKDPQSIETSVTLAWRKAAWHAILAVGWLPTTTEEDVALLKGMLESGAQVWRDAYPDSGAYFNEASTTEPHWQQAFWGKNYDRLLQIKKTVDPSGMLVCSQCVGSEAWDPTGNCRLQ